MERYICQNCDEVWVLQDLVPLCEIEERVQPGDTMPDGECPSCGCACFAEPTPEEQARERVRDAGPELLAALENMLEWLDRTGESRSAGGKEYEYVTAARAAVARAREVTK